MRKYSVATIAAIVALLLAAWSYRDSGAPTANGRAIALAPSQDRPPPQSAPMPAEQVASDPVRPRSTRNGPSRKVNLLFATARDYRVAFEELLQRQQEGGGFYARNILSICSGLRDLTSDLAGSEEITGAQAAARQLLKDRCSGFTPEEISEARKRGLLTDTRLKDDPLILAQRVWNQESPDPQNRAAALSQVLATKDPLLIEGVLASVIFIPDPGGLYFNGNSYSQTNARQVMSMAVLAATCQIYDDACGALDSYVVTACAMKNSCYSSRMQLFDAAATEQFGSAGHALYTELVPKLTLAINSGDARAFIRR